MSDLEPVTAEEARPSRDITIFKELIRKGNVTTHSYTVLVGLKLADLPQLLRSVMKGLPWWAFERLCLNLSLPPDQVAELVQISKRTLIRRKQEGRFEPDESDRLLRTSRVYGKALELFEGSRDGAVEWLTSPQTALGGAVPLELSKTELGAREVEAVLHRLEHGVFS